MHHQDLDGDVAKVSDKAPFFRGKPMFIDPRQERFVSAAEQRILNNKKWPDGMKKFNIDGHIVLHKPPENAVFFNSKFESANLN